MSLTRLSSTLVIAEHDCTDVMPLTYNSICAAKQLGGDISVLVVGKDCSSVSRYTSSKYDTCMIMSSVS